MPQADNPAPSLGQSSTELLIVGAGIMGLWAAVHAARRGIKTVLVDAGEPGAGASGGLLGALMAHMPDRWNDKKQFQFDALVSLEDEIAALQAQTGRSAGYRRCGRLIPLPKPHLRDIAQGHSQDALLRWKTDDRQFHWQVIDQAPVPNWLTPQAGACGVVHDSLAGRVSPRLLLALLRQVATQSADVTLLVHRKVDSIDFTRGRAEVGGEILSFSRCVLSAGHNSFAMLQPVFVQARRCLGKGVKGQAALFDAHADPTLPMIFRDGLYVIAHDNGQVAVGSTSEEEYDDPISTDSKLDKLIERAFLLVPSLRNAPVLERWAGLRPKAVDRDPMVGSHPEVPRLVALTGGFKISFGIAHVLAQAALETAIDGTSSVCLPASFSLESQVAAASMP